MTGSNGSPEGFRERVAQGVLVADGAMGTVLHAAGNPLERALPELNLSDPDQVQRIHDSYLATGVELIQTNTFGASRLRLEVHGLGDRTAEINMAGVRVARAAASAAGRPVFVAGSVAPAVTLQQRRRVAPADREAAVREQVAALVAAGVDVIVLETFGYLDELVEAAGVAVATGVPVLAQATFAADGRTLGGDTPHDVCAALADLPVAALGTNCTLGPQGVLAVVQELRSHTDLPMSALPNAGLPRRTSGPRFSYDVDAHYFARYAQLLVAAGVSVVGGCCGTTPAHLDAVVRAIARTVPGVASRRAAAVAEPTAAGAAAERPGPRFDVLAEIQAPQAGHVAEALTQAEAVQALGVNRVWVPAGDGPRAQLNPVNLAVHLQNQLDVEALASVTTWDRTIMALQADLLGAHALGVRRVVCETGSPPLLGDYPHVDGVWDVDSIGLVELLAGLNDGRDCNGLRLAGKTAFEIGVRVAPGSHDLHAEAARALRKVEAGAQFLITRPVYDFDSLQRLRDVLGEPAPLLVSVRPLRSFAEAEYLAHEVPDTAVPAATLVALDRADSGRDGAAGGGAARAGVELAAELVRAARTFAAGVVLALPSDAEAAAELLAAARGD
ncbi:bifunctional homocysteine S-methyltransferase/methylenetetrahydrofolate reductase [Pseudonocardia alaniniphila]|uniref:Bifunctional homocysteine S-methyltransferase/methylenetetrahydrofolate reductase n=1 Tax=Pseudonocardia alaniniphila TaxID=75291 RepID=A0ABS9TAI3_9PSEU|nr:bifunctional homocysteine S-methyltransferase/methylenetetrahydrofolate reductase [Pseudonocardia alaniniphila]MCH6165521.1 bifunctional homocysteine S-methyltransferase/methylenetetrahydrofolate reductase [Pseudonocardia alaniniphila]